MKKIPVVLIVIMTFISVFSQDSKPTLKSAILIGGEANFGWQVINLDEAEDAIHLINLGISPTLGYFIKDKLALGLTPSIAFSLTSQDNSVLYLGISPFIKYYFDNGFILRGSTGHTFGLFMDDNNDPWTSHLIPVSFGFGYAIFLNSKVALEFYLNDILSINLQGSSSYTNLQNNLFFSAGLQVFL